MSRTKMRAPGNNSEKKDKYRAKKLAEKLAAAENTTAGEGPAAVGKDKKAKKEKKGMKEKKEKKDKKSNPEAVAEPTLETPAAESAAAPTTAESEAPAAAKDASSPSKKRKRDTTTSEIEIDVTLPEPPSKKALRKLKKHPDLADKLIKPSPVAAGASSTPKAAEKTAENFPEHSSQVRSKWGIWIGNLGFSTTRPQLEEFLTRPPSTIQRIEVTRINLPTDPRTKRNRGFAYIDFANEKALDYALQLTETLFLGRKVLIKNSNDFSGRGSGTTPDGSSSGPVKLGPNLSSKPPSKILFVGNLDFATTEEDLKAHFAFAGPIHKIRLATFEDTGKCKGFGFVDFEDIDSVKRAMLGLSAEEEAAKPALEGKEEEELAKRQKKRRFLGTRQIKMEYGEDSSVRYKKRFGKDRPEGERAERVEVEEFKPRQKRAPKADEDDWAERAWEERRQKQDKRDTDPGAVYSNDVRRTGAITESKGTKMKFD
ncbi:hypothetical protein DFP73DRAFT_542142 [Morchella snyderi]|nr:hypothetical protein DFP73DRAFT_542142 [Morchella snyderi]